MSLYENQREKLRGKLFETCGIAHLDLNLLLDVKTDDDYKEWRTLILSELETFVAETKPFATFVPIVSIPAPPNTLR